MTEKELLPCPFCGASARYDWIEVGCAVKCYSCDVSVMRGSVGVGWYATEAEAAADWNRRAQPAEAEGAEFPIARFIDYKRDGAEWMVRAVDHDAALSAVTAERDRLQAALSAPDTITAEPAGDYDNLRKQFLSLRMLANSNAKMVHHWRAQCGRETRETLLANAASVNAERDTNSMLTDALETAERERDQLRAEVEALRKDAERLDRLDIECEAYGCEGIHEGNRWMIDGPFRTVRDAIDAAMQGEQL